MAALRRLERLLWIMGIVLIAGYAGIRVYQAAQARRDVRAFEKRLPSPGPPVPPAPSLETPAAPPPLTLTPVILEEKPADTSLWDAKRIREYQESLREQSASPVAVLKIPKIGLEVAVFAGTDDFVLNRGVGWIEGTARPGEIGNSGIAGHRDGFFRPLKDIAPGDAIEIVGLSGTRRYQVESIQLVRPEDVQVLDPTPGAALTLVSCYPFYFVGSAPQRFIVRAVSLEPQGSASAELK
jgi:sortase A